MTTTNDYRALSPVDVEQKLRQVVTEISRAEQALREARDAETDAEIEYRRTHRRAMLSPDCPIVTRGGTTTAERDAWVDEAASTDWENYRLAQAKCQAAADHVRATRDIATAVQSIGSLVRQAFQIGGANE